MSSILSSSGCRLQLSKDLLAIPTNEGVTIIEWSTNSDNSNHTIQHIEHAQPFNVLWSQNSAHLVVIGSAYIYLYACVTEDGRHNWVRERTVEAPRNLLDFPACYSHPLLSIELNQHSNQTNTGSGEVVVINLLCSLFQTFSIATPCSSGSGNHQHTYSTHSANRLSYSGRYLSTAQVTGSNPIHNTPTLGVRVYDLYDLWVLQVPTQASYLDFKYADLSVESVAAHVSSTSSTSEDKQGDFSVGAPIETPQWGVTQLEWRHTDAHSFAEDSYELFFLAQHRLGSAAPTLRRSDSVGIADDQLHYTDTEGASPTANAGGDVTVSIYSVSQQPDYANISILTMAYNAAIVAGQLNQQDDYLLNISQGNYSGIHSAYASNSDSGANLSALNTPGSALNSVNKAEFTHATTLTTTLNLLTVVSLSSLCRSVDATPTGYASDCVFNTHKSGLLFCWVETGAARVPSNIQSRTVSSISAKRGKEEEAGAPLWLAVTYDSHTAHPTSHTSTQPSQRSCCSTDRSYAYRVFGVKYQQATEGADNASAYVPVFVSDDRICTTLNIAAGPPQYMRCIGDPSQCLNNRPFATKGGHLLSGAVASKLEIVCSFAYASSDTGHIKALAVILSTASVLVSVPPDSTLSPASTSSAVTLSTNLLSWRANLMNMPSPLPLNAVPDAAVLHTSPLLPSANVRFVRVDASASLYQIVPTSSETQHSQPVTVVSMAELGAGYDTCAITAVTADSFVDCAVVRFLYVLYSIAGSYYIGVWKLDMSSQQRICKETRRSQRDRDVHYPALQDGVAGAAAGPGVAGASWRAAPVDTNQTPSVITNMQTTTAHAHAHSEEYTVQVLPDPHFGLGIRIDVLDSRTVVSSFKRHPISNLAMSAQLTGCIHPGDEFVAINGIILRGRALAEVIHTIRTTVSEGGDSTVVLTMRRVTSTSPSSGTGLALRKPEHVRNISSMSSIASAVSMNSFSDGLDSMAHRSAAAASNAAVGSPSIDHADASDTPQSSNDVPVCVMYSFVGKVAFDASIESADLTVLSERGGGSSVFLISVHRNAKVGVLRTTLSIVSVTRETVAIEQVDRCELTLRCGWDSNGTGRCTVQLWSAPEANRGNLRCTILVTPTAPPANLPGSVALDWTSDHMPTLLVVDISQLSARTAHKLQKSVFFDLIPLNGVNTSQSVQHSSVGVMLCDDPMSKPGLMASLAMNGVQGEVQLRFQQSLKDHVPLHLTYANPFYGVQIDGLTVATQLLQCLSIADVANSERERVVSAVSPALLRILEQALAVNASEGTARGAASTNGDCLSAALRAIFASGGSSSTILQEVDGLHLNTPAQRAVWLTVFVKALCRNSSPTAEEAPTSRKFLLHGAAVANLLWSKQAITELAQPRVLPLLIPNSIGDGATQSRMLSQLVSQQCDDILEHLTSIHAALWLHDISVLMDVVYKHSVKAFKQHKSSIKIFLEMVLVGKEDTLLQLAKTDREKSGKQLLALFTLEDSFATPKARKSLQKNAFALMKLGRYKDAAAVFLLADPPFIKEACSVLQAQHDDPLFALLVTRLAEHRCAVTKIATPSAAKSSTVDVSSSSATTAAVAVYNGGYLLGPVARMLLKSSVIPSLLACTRRSSLRATQMGTSSAAAASASPVGATISAAYARIIGTNALVLSLVSTMWLQDHAMLKAAFRESIGRYTLVDACRVSAAATGDVTLSAEVITALASVDWLVEIGAYAGTKHYNSSIKCTNEFLMQAGLHEGVVKSELLHSQAARRNIQSLLNDNAFLQLCSAFYHDYEAHQERAAAQIAVIEPEKSEFFFLQGPQDDSTCATPVSSTNNVMFTEGTDGSEEDEQYKEVLRRLAKFQTAAPDSLHTSVATPGGGVGAVTSAAGTASPAVAGIAARDTDAPAPVKTGGGFNFAASAKPAPLRSARADPSVSAPSTLDAFDVPAPPVRRPQRDTRVNAGASLDMLGDGLDTLAPPTRHRRPGVTAGSESPTVNTPFPKESLSTASEPVNLEAASTGSNAPADIPKQRGFNFAPTVSTTAAPVKGQGLPAARTTTANPTRNALDDFDSFAAPVRPRRQPAPVLATTELSEDVPPAVTPVVPSALDAFGSFGSFAAPMRSRRQPQPTPVMSLEDTVSAGSSPRSDITASPVPARATVPSADAFDSFGPPVRARRQPATPPTPAPEKLTESATHGAATASQEQDLPAVPDAFDAALSSVPTATAYVPSALDAFDSFDSFAAPTRHTRAKR